MAVTTVKGMTKWKRHFMDEQLHFGLEHNGGDNEFRLYYQFNDFTSVCIELLQWHNDTRYK